MNQDSGMASNIATLNTYNQMAELSRKIENDMDNKRQPTPQQIDPAQLQQLQLQQQMLQQQQRMQQMQQPMQMMMQKTFDKGGFLGFTGEMFKETAVVAVLFLIFSLPYIMDTLGNYLPILASGDNGPSMVSLAARGVLVGALYLFIKRFFIVNN